MWQTKAMFINWTQLFPEQAISIRISPQLETNSSYNYKNVFLVCESKSKLKYLLEHICGLVEVDKGTTWAQVLIIEL